MSVFLKCILGFSGILGLAYAMFMGAHNNSVHYANTLSEDSVQGNYDYGQKYARFLSGIDSSPENDVWWQWVFFSRYRWAQIPETSGFYGKTHPNQLRTSCKEAYEGKFNPQTKMVVNGTVNYGEEEVWKLCSSSSKGLVPMSVASADKDMSITQVHRTSLDGDMKEKLLSIHHPNNDWAWTLRQRKFDRERISDGFFASKSNGIYVRDKCQKAYEVTLPEHEKQDLIKWCGF